MAKITQYDDKAVVQLGHDLVASTIPEVKEQLKELVNKGQRIAVDLDGVNMIDSTGIGLLMATHNSLQQHDQSLEVHNASDNILKLFQTMRLDKRFIMV